MVPEDSHDDFGRLLKAHRLQQGCSIEEIARKTKITPTCLQQIENQDLNLLPQEVYVKGFLRAYAEAVGCDAGEVLRRYQNRCGMQQQFCLNIKPTPEGNHFWLRFIIALISLLVVMGVTIYTHSNLA